jgi:hypothetical protein
MTAAEALAAAEAEGLTLVPADNPTGFKYVGHETNSVSKPFKATARRDGSSRHLGMFETAEEAALAVARFLGPESGAAALATAPAPETAPMTASAAHAAAEAEGLTLVRADHSTGFKGVYPSVSATASRSWRRHRCRTAGYTSTWAYSQRRRRRR